MKQGKKAVVILGLVTCLTFFSFSLGRAAEKTKLTWGAGGVGGAWFIAATAISGVLAKHSPLEATVVPGGGHANPIRVSNKQLDVAFSYIGESRLARDGKEPYKAKMTNLAALGNLGLTNYWLIAAVKDTGINSFSELIKKKYPLRLGPGTRGLGAELTMQRILEEYGMNYQTIINWGGKVTFASWSESVGLVRDGHMDATLQQGPPNSPAVVELCNSRNMVFWPMEDGVIKALVAKYGYRPAKLHKGEYKGVVEDTPTVAVDTIIIVCNDLPEAVVYDMAKGIYEHKSELIDAYSQLSTFDPSAIANVGGLPIHPGAAKFYREKGLIK